MSRTWDLILVARPYKLPATVFIQCEASVENLEFSKEDEGELKFCVTPTWFDSPIIRRRLAFSEEKKPSLPFKYFKAGEMELDGKKVFLLLEKAK